MKKAVSLGLFVLFMTPLLAAQDYKGRARIKGFVYDKKGNPIEGVTVKLFSVKAQDGFEVETNSEGKWVAAWIRGGQWNIDFKKVGYKPKKISVNVKSYGRNPPIEVKMKKMEGLMLTDELKDRLKEGNQLYEQGKNQEALEKYKSILEEFPDAYIVNRNIGNCYFKMEKYDKAVEFYKKVLEEEPDNKDLIMSIGNCYANQGKSDLALEWYNKIEFEEIDDATVLYNIGTDYYNLNKFEKALKYYQRSVEINPEFLDSLYQLGLTHLNMGNNEKAVQVFEKYLEKDPDSPRASKVKGFLDYLKKK